MNARIPDRRAWQALTDVADRSTRYLERIGERRVAPSPDALAGLKAFDVPLQDHPMSAEEVVDELDRIGSLATMAIAGPRFFGFVNSSALPAALAANWLSTAWEQHGGFFAYSTAQRIQEIGIRMALGARRADILTMVLKEGVMIGAVGLTLGIAAALALTRFLSGLLFGVGARDPIRDG